MDCLSTIRRRICTGLIVLLSGGALLAGCGGDEEDEQDAPVRQDIPDADCDDSLAATLIPSPEVTENTDVATYEFSMSGTRADVDLLDAADNSLGRLEIDVETDLAAATGLVEEWRVGTRLVEGEATAAEQTLRGRSIGNDRFWFETVHRIGDDELIQWVVVDDQQQPVDATLAVKLDGDADPTAGNRMETVDGRIFEVLEVLEEDGERIDSNAIDNWIDDQFGGAFRDDSAWGRLAAFNDDPALWEGADAQIRRCEAASTDGIEEDLVELRQPQCAAQPEDDDSQQLHQPLCDGDDSDKLDRLGNANDLFISARAGILITGALVVAGTVTGGWAIAATFVGVTIAHRLISNAISDAAKDNSDVIMDAAGTAGSQVTGYEEDGDAFSDFFGGSQGDPHFDTFDGTSYDFHGAGEFALVESHAGEPFVVQTRQEPVEGNCPNVGINTAAATEVGDTRIGFYAEEPNPLFIDGQPAALPGGVLALDNGATISHGGANDDSSDTFAVQWPGGEYLEVRRREWSDNALLDVRVGLPRYRQGQVQGLLGNFNGEPGGDLVTRDGRRFTPPVAWGDLTSEFGHSWRIDPDDSLFDYAEGEDSSTFTDEDFPTRPTTLEDLDEDDRQWAENECEAADIDDEVAFESCVIDVACTGSADLTDSHRDRDTGEELDTVIPIFLDDWTQEGDPDNGDWAVSDDGRSVVQSVNGDPTFFVSPREYHDVTIRGTFFVDENWDDDFIGFVFGYQSPLSENDDNQHDIETFLLSWKAHDQEVNDQYFGAEGFVLTHIDGEVPSSEERRVMWAYEDTEVQDVIDTYYRHGIGWRHETEYPFELTYTDEEIVVVIGGEEIFRVDAADSPADFEPGRFGFYNHSQEDVHYGGFESGDAEDNPTASLAGIDYDMDRPGDSYAEFEMDTGDPRLCRDACFDDPRCISFRYQRPYWEGPPPYCWLQEEAPAPVDDDAYISGVQ